MNILKQIAGAHRRVNPSWNEVKANWFVRLVHRFVFILFALSIGMLLWRWTMLPPMIPLWYSRPWGTDQLASPYFLLILPVASLLLYGINVMVTMYIMAEYLIFTQMLYLSSLIVSLLSFLALLKILFMVT